MWCLGDSLSSSLLSLALFSNIYYFFISHLSYRLLESASLIQLLPNYGSAEQLSKLAVGVSFAIMLMDTLNMKLLNHFGQWEIFFSLGAVNISFRNKLQVFAYFIQFCITWKVKRQLSRWLTATIYQLLALVLALELTWNHNGPLDHAPEKRAKWIFSN